MPFGAAAERLRAAVRARRSAPFRERSTLIPYPRTHGREIELPGDDLGSMMIRVSRWRKLPLHAYGVSCIRRMTSPV